MTERSEDQRATLGTAKRDLTVGTGPTLEMVDP